jgi:hypothetical protein
MISKILPTVVIAIIILSSLMLTNQVQAKTYPNKTRTDPKPKSSKYAYCVNLYKDKEDIRFCSDKTQIVKTKNVSLPIKKELFKKSDLAIISGNKKCDSFVKYDYNCITTAKEIK